jgi:hypothetical protein
MFGNLFQQPAQQNGQKTNQQPNYNNYFKMMGLASGLGGIASGLYGMFGNQQDPSAAANKYYEQISQQPGVQNLQGQYGQLMNDPGGKYNQIGESFQQSPGFKFAMQQAMNAQNHAAAAGGMAGSPMHEQMAQQTATDLANQDYYNYMQGATGLYGQGLNGQQNINDLISQQFYPFLMRLLL